MNTLPLLNPGLQRLFDCMPVNAATVIIAAHSCLAEQMREQPCACSAEFMTFKAGLSLARRAQDYGKPCRLVLWINDVGSDPGTRRSLRTDYVLPDNYSDALSQAGLSRHDLILMFASSERTKALTVLRRFYKFAILIAGSDKSQLVAKEGGEPEYHFTLATFFESVRRRFSPGFQINIFNQASVKHLPLGVQVSRIIFENQTPMANLFCKGDVESMVCLIDLPDLKSKPSCVMKSE